MIKFVLFYLLTLWSIEGVFSQVSINELLKIIFIEGKIEMKYESLIKIRL